MSTYYSEYVNHILRFYVRHPDASRFHTDIERQNFKAAQIAVARLDDESAEIIREVYGRRDTIGDNVREVASRRGIEQDAIYKLLARVSHVIAKERKLI